jgi:hypothetical protein
MPIILWTDALVFLLVACAIGAGFYVNRREYLLASWRRVGESRAGMASLTVLAAFIAVGLLDSLHYRPRLDDVPGRTTANGYGSEVRSALDALLQPLRLVPRRPIPHRWPPTFMPRRRSNCRTAARHGCSRDCSMAARTLRTPSRTGEGTWPPGLSGGWRSPYWRD